MHWRILFSHFYRKRPTTPRSEVFQKGKSWPSRQDLNPFYRRERWCERRPRASKPSEIAGSCLHPRTLGPPLSEPVAVKLAVKNRGQGRLSDRSPALAFLVAGREICRVAYHYLLQLRHLERSGSLVRCFTGLPWSIARRWLARRSTGLGRSVRKIELCARHCRIVIEA